MNHPNTSARVLALDLAQTSGWALIGNGVITSGSQCFASKPKKGHSPHEGNNFCRFDNWIRDRLCDDKPEAVCFEEVFRWMSSSAAHSFCGFRAIMMVQCTRKGIPCYGYSPTTIKKAWTGNGAAKKELMMETTLMRFPDIDLTDNNEADAIAILSLHLSTLKTAKA